MFYESPFFVYIVLGMFALTVIAAIALFFPLIKAKHANKNLILVDVNSAQDLSEEEKDKISFIKYDVQSGEIIVRCKDIVKRLVVSVIYVLDGKTKVKRFNLGFFSSNECGIDMRGISSYRVVVESVNGAVIKGAKATNDLLFTLIYGVVVAALYALAIIFYVMLCSTYLQTEYLGYAAYYVFAAFGLLFPAILVGGRLLVESLQKKGGK